jgi:hypothetical protein
METNDQRPVVFILYEMSEYPLDTVVSVHATREGADAAMAQLVADSKPPWNYTITEVELKP